MAKTPSKHRKSRSASRSTTPPPRAHGSARKSPYPTKKSSFPTIQDALGSLGLDDALIKYHTWPFSKQGVDSESGLMVCSGHVNDSETNPKESFFSTRAIIPIKNKTMLVEHSQRYICSGFCTDKNGDPALWIQQPGTLETPLANGMADLNALSMFANLMFGGDNKALNEEMKKTYIEASEFGDLEKATIDVITLPTLSANEYDDEEEEEDEGNTGTKKWFYSNAKYNNYPDKSNNLIVRPPVHELKPVVYYPQGGQSVQNLKGNMTVANGYVMVQVYVEGSRRNLTMPKATKDEVDYDAYMEKVAKQVQDSLKVSQAQGQASHTQVTYEVKSAGVAQMQRQDQGEEGVGSASASAELLSIEEENAEEMEMEHDDDAVERDQEQEQEDEGQKVTQMQPFQSLVNFGWQLMPGRDREWTSSSRSRSRSRSRSPGHRRSLSNDPIHCAAAAASAAAASSNSFFREACTVANDSNDDDEVNEMDTHEFFTEGIKQKGGKGKKLKVEKQRGMTSLEAAAVRAAAAEAETAEEEEFLDFLDDSINLKTDDAIDMRDL